MKDRPLAFRAPESLILRLDELASHRGQHRSALLRDLIEASLVGGDLAALDFGDPVAGEGMRLVAGHARGGDAASARELARLQERARLAKRDHDRDPFGEIWADDE